MGGPLVPDFCPALRKQRRECRTPCTKGQDMGGIGSFCRPLVLMSAAVLVLLLLTSSTVVAPRSLRVLKAVAIVDDEYEEEEKEVMVVGRVTQFEDELNKLFDDELNKKIDGNAKQTEQQQQQQTVQQQQQQQQQTVQQQQQQQQTVQQQQQQQQQQTVQQQQQIGDSPETPKLISDQSNRPGDQSEASVEESSSSSAAALWAPSVGSAGGRESEEMAMDAGVVAESGDGGSGGEGRGGEEGSGRIVDGSGDGDDSEPWSVLFGLPKEKALEAINAYHAEKISPCKMREGRLHLFSPYQVVVQKFQGILKWEPSHERFVLLDCHRGQASNRMRCITRYLFLAGLLNRTLIIPETTPNAYVFYDFRLLFDMDLIKFCLPGSVMWLSEYLEKFGQVENGQKKLVVDQVLCWEEDCYDSNKGRPDVLPNSTGIVYANDLVRGNMDLKRGSSATFSELSEKVQAARGKVIVFGDMESFPAFLSDRIDLYSHGDLPFFRAEGCWLSRFVAPPKRFFSAARRFVRRKFGGSNFLGVHLRRGDLFQNCDNRHCNLTIEEVARCIGVKLRETNTSKVFLATDTHADEIGRLQGLLAGQAEVFTLPRGISKPFIPWLNSLEGRLGRNRKKVRATIDKMVCVLSTAFLGTKSSSFSEDIQKMRGSLLKATCHDAYICEEEVENFALPVVQPKSVNLRLLEGEISSDSLTAVSLGRTKIISDSGPLEKENFFSCAGGACPRFAPCLEDKSLGVSAGAIDTCTNEAIYEEINGSDNDDDDDFAKLPVNCRSSEGATNNFNCIHEGDKFFLPDRSPQIFSLENVYVHPMGFAFNESFIFDPSNCQRSTEMFRFSNMKVDVFSTLINMALPPTTDESDGDTSAALQSSAPPSHSHSYYRGLVQLIPLFLTLSPLLSSLAEEPIVVTKEQFAFLSSVSSDLLGKPVEQLNLVTIPETSSSQGEPKLLLARHLIQPLSQNCGRPSRALISPLRTNYLLPPGALPLLSEKRSIRDSSAPPRASSTSALSLSNWLVVLCLGGWDATSANSSFARKVESVTRSLAPSSRVSLINRSVPFGEAKRIFNQAAILVADHRSPMFANMVMMPPDASVVELRPSSHPHTLYHHLAVACKLNYHLLLTNQTDAAGSILPDQGDGSKASSFASAAMLDAELLPILRSLLAKLPGTAAADPESSISPAIGMDPSATAGETSGGQNLAQSQPSGPKLVKMAPEAADEEVVREDDVEEQGTAEEVRGGGEAEGEVEEKGREGGGKNGEEVESKEETGVQIGEEGGVGAKAGDEDSGEAAAAAGAEAAATAAGGGEQMVPPESVQAVPAQEVNAEPGQGLGSQGAAVEPFEDEVHIVDSGGSSASGVLIETSVLPRDVERLSLRKVSLVEFDQPHTADFVLKCRDPPSCPAVANCSDTGFESIQACQNDGLRDELKYPPAPENCPKIAHFENGGPDGMDEKCSHGTDFVWHDAHSFKVLALRDVFVDCSGLVFDLERFYDPKGCMSNKEFSFNASSTIVRKVNAPVVNLIYQHALAFYHSLIEWVPQFFLLGQILRAHPSIPILLRSSQVDVYKSFAKFVVGMDEEDLNILTIDYRGCSNEVFASKTVIQSPYQLCGKPSPSLWHELRRMHFLPSEGLPFYEATKLQLERLQSSGGSHGEGNRPIKWLHRTHAAYQSEEQMATLPSDWVVVMARRPGRERSLEGADEIRAELENLFQPDRVVEFNGSLHILEAKKLFNRAALYVGAHGAALSNMIFMPVNSSIIEIRPKDYPNACYHHLSSACRLHYFLTFGRGSKETKLGIDVPKVLELVREVAGRIKSGPLKRYFSGGGEEASLSDATEQPTDIRPPDDVSKGQNDDISSPVQAPEADRVESAVGPSAEKASEEAAGGEVITPAEVSADLEGQPKEEKLNLEGITGVKIRNKVVDGRVVEDALLENVVDDDDNDEEANEEGQGGGAGGRDRVHREHLRLDQDEEEEGENLVGQGGVRTSSSDAGGRRNSKTDPNAITWTTDGEEEGMLEEDMDRSKMKLVILDKFFNDRNRPFFRALCGESMCPEMETCSEGPEGEKSISVEKSCSVEGFIDEEIEYMRPPINCPMIDPSAREVSEGINKSCSHVEDFRRHDKIALKVFVLRNVFISGEGHVFDRDYFYMRNGCNLDKEFVFPANTTRVRKLKTIVNLTYRQGGGFYHGLIEWLPSFFVLSNFLAAMPDVPLLARGPQWWFYNSAGFPLIGVPSSTFNGHAIKDDELFFAEKVYQPLYQLCGNPSRAVWRTLRRKFLLPRNGIPMFGPNFSLRNVPPVDEEASLIPMDWVVVLGKRAVGKRSMDKVDEIETSLKRLFPPNRVHVFNGSLSGLGARSLFRRARLFVTGHGAGLSNMIFMPVNSTVLEIRPDKDPNACYHHLAEACKIRYYLTMGEGSAHGVVHVDMVEINRILFEVAAELPPLPFKTEPDYGR